MLECVGEGVGEGVGARCWGNVLGQGVGDGVGGGCWGRVLVMVLGEGVGGGCWVTGSLWLSSWDVPVELTGCENPWQLLTNSAD